MLQRNIAHMMLVLSPPLVWLTYLEFFVHAGANVGIRQACVVLIAMFMSGSSILFRRWPFDGWPRYAEALAYGICGISVLLLIVFLCTSGIALL